MKPLTKLQKDAILTFGIYMLLLTWIIGLKCNMETPVFFSKNYMGGMSLAERAEWSFCHFRFTGEEPIYLNKVIDDILVNIFLFLAVGMIWPLFFNNKNHLFAPLFGFGISFFLEISQFFNTIGGFAYIDLITNTLGATIGALLTHTIMKRISDRTASIILNIFAVVFGIFVIYGTINTIVNIEIYYV